MKRSSLLMGLLAGLMLFALSGCSLPASRDRAPAVLTLPEDMVLAWASTAAAVEAVEVTVSEGGPGGCRTVTVAIRMVSSPS